jgi:Flp pilus assembly protein TadG
MVQAREYLIRRMRVIAPSVERALIALSLARRLGRCRRGVAALEFALVSVPLTMMIFGFIATNAIFYTWSTMQNSVQNAALLMATGQITSFQSSATTCAVTLGTTQAEYYACQNLPSWATFTVTASESCTAPATVTVRLSVNASTAGLADTYSFYSGKTLLAQATMMKQGTCP